MSSTRYSVADVAALLNLKATKKGGKIEYHGANPTGTGATKDGFILFEAGHAHDRNGAKYNSPEVAKLAGISPNDYAPVVLFVERNGRAVSSNGASNGSGPVSIKTAPFDWSRAQTFDYTDEEGRLLFQVGRIGTGEAKDVRQRKPNGRGGWSSTLGNVRKVLYVSACVRRAETVFLVEGEKAADALNAEFEKHRLSPEYVATTNPGGAEKWRPEFNAELRGRTVYVLPDNDERGERHAQQVRASLDALPDDERPKLLRRVDLPGLPEKGDVADFFQLGGELLTLLELAEAAPQWEKVTEEGEETLPRDEGAAAPTKERFFLQTLAQLEARPAPQWLIHRFLTIGGTSVLTAKHASFKSFFALDMALAVATGTPWQGFEVATGRVVYVAAEGASGLTKRARAWQRRHKSDFKGNLLVLDAPLKVHEEGTRAAFIAQIVALQPVLIVLDTLARCAVGLDENSSGDMGIFADAIGDLAKATGAHVMVVHHNNKTGEYRGSTALPAAVDTHLSLERSNDAKSNACTLRTEKQKDFEEWGALGFEGNAVALDEGSEETSLVFEKSDLSPENTGRTGAPNAEQKVFEALEAIATEEGATSGMWKAAATAAKVSNGAFYMAVKSLTASTNGQPARVLMVSGEAGGQSTKAPRYAPNHSTTPLLQTTPIGAMEQLGNPNHSTTPPLHSPVGSGVDWSSGVDAAKNREEEKTDWSGSSLGELKPKKRKRSAGADSENGYGSLRVATVEPDAGVFRPDD